MGVVLIYDWDYFHYPGVIPNLECAKLAAYEKKKRNITVFHNNFEPPRYTKAYFRKEYDDGIYDQKILLPNVEYGGRAFSKQYLPFSSEMEQIEPDFEIYQRFKNYYGWKKADQQQIKTLLYATHLRLSTDGINLNPIPFERFRPRHPCIVFHDYNIAATPSSFEAIKEIMYSRPRGLTYHIGNKYPINIYNYEELKQWLTINPMGNCFYLQYNGVFTDEQMIELLSNQTMTLRSMVYNFTYGCQDEDDFIIRVLPEIYKQALFLRRHKVKFLLNIDDEFFKTSELLNLMKLINCWYGKTFIESFPRPTGRTLYGYCSSTKVAQVELYPWQKLTVNREQMRESFQYMRIKNYDVFDKFYSAPGVLVQGGKLVYGWERNSLEN